MTRRLTLLCLALALTLSGGLYAQGVQTATLIGTVTDSEGSPMPGVTVTASSPNQMGDQTAITETNGDYVIRGLTPGDYVVRFSLEGMATSEARVTLGLGVTTRANASMEMLAQEETIVVTAEAPPALESTTVGANFSSGTVAQLPIVNRSPVGIASLAGAVTDRTPVAGQLSINGGMAYDNSFLINGVNVQDPIFGQTNNLFIEDAIQETQVLTSGISAEYGGFSGGVMNVITKSGGNDFSGSVRASFNRPEWRDETPFEEDRGIEREGDLGKFYAATLGGRIIRDRLWFFLAGRDEEAVDLRSTLAAGNVTDTQENRRYEVKLTGNITPRHSLQGSYIDNPVTSSHEIQVAPLEEAAMARNSERINDGFALSYTGVLSNNLFAEARYSEKVFTFVNTGGTETNIFRSPIRSATRFAGNTAGTFNAPYFDSTDPEDRNNEQASAALSYFLSSERLGSHDIKVGAERFSVIRTGGNGQSATDYVFYTGYQTSGGQPVLAADGRLIPIFVPGISGSRLGWWVPTRGAELDITTDSFFINDRWDVNDRLTVNMGIRHEQVRSEATGGIVGVDTDTTVPRLGISFDPLANGKYKLDVTYAEYAGRYNPSIIGRNSPVGTPSLLYGYYVGPAGSGHDFAPGFDPNNYVFFYASVPTQNTFFEKGLSSPVNEEITFSAGMALPRGGFMKATFIDRELTGFIDDFNSMELGSTQINFAGENWGFFDNKEYRNTDGPTRTYQAIQLQGRYNILPNWAIEGNFTHQLENDGNYEGEGGQAIGATLFGDYPELYVPARNNPTGRLSQFQENKVRLWTTYSLDLGRAGTLGTGLIYRYDSPLTFSYTHAAQPFSAIQRARNPGYASPPASQTIFFGERGAGEYNSTSLFDISLTYSIPAFRSIEPWIKLDVTNVFNDDTLVTYNTGILSNTAPANCGGSACPVDADGIPTTFRPGTIFGQATSATNHVTPREFFIAAGIRF